MQDLIDELRTNGLKIWGQHESETTNWHRIVDESGHSIMAVRPTADGKYIAIPLGSLFVEAPADECVKFITEFKRTDSHTVRIVFDEGFAAPLHEQNEDIILDALVKVADKFTAIPGGINVTVIGAGCEERHDLPRKKPVRKRRPKSGE